MINGADNYLRGQDDEEDVASTAKSIQWQYTISQLFKSLALIMMALTQFMYDENSAELESIEWLMVFFLSLPVAAACSFTTYNFVGKSARENFCEAFNPDVTDSENNHMHNFPENEPFLQAETTPFKRILKIGCIKSGYLLTMMFYLLATNIFFGGGAKAWINAVTSDNEIEVWTKLSNIEMLLITLYTLLVDLPFDGSNEWYENLETITEKYYGDTSLIASQTMEQRLLKPLANSAGITWVTVVGTLGHVCKHIFSLLLIIPPHFFRAVKKNKWLLGASVTGIAAVGLPIILFNVLQTYYFEAVVSKANLLALIQENKGTIEQAADFFEKQFNRIKKLPPSSTFKRFFLGALGLSQPILHAIDDTLPPAYLSWAMLSGASLQTRILGAGAISYYQFIVGSRANFFAETLPAMKALKETPIDTTHTINETPLQ